MRYLFLALSILSTIFIFSNSLLNGNLSIEESDRFTFIVISIVEDITGKSPDYNTISLVVRKLAHFIEFFLAGLFYCLTFFLFKNKRFHFFSLGICAIIALSDEGLQILSNGRSASLIDSLIDFLGSLTAIFLVILFTKKKSFQLTNKE